MGCWHGEAEHRIASITWSGCYAVRKEDSACLCWPARSLARSSVPAAVVSGVAVCMCCARGKRELYDRFASLADLSSQLVTWTYLLEPENSVVESLR
ncbi:hypothetical protein VTL71DRAFT_16022, partial [Oculimacula yallundae]